MTFEIVPLQDIKRPHILTVWIKALRIRSFLTVLFPLFLVLSKNLIGGSGIDPWTLLFATWGVLFLFAAVNLRNDYVDHMKGFDRIDSKLGNRPIQSGWVTAESVRKVSGGFLLLAVLMSLPVMLAFPEISVFVLGAGCLGYLTLFRLRRTFKEWAGGEFGILILVGPLLTCGFELAITGNIFVETLFLGLLWGWMALLPVHLKNLSLIVSQSQAGVSNLMTYFGFDRGKKLIYYWWLAAIILYAGYHYFYTGAFWAVALSFLVTLASLGFSIKLLKLQSPVGSEMEALLRRGMKLVDLVIILWVVDRLWKINL